jgi:hypothetical protein
MDPSSLWGLVPPKWQPYVGIAGLIVMAASNLAAAVPNQGALIPRILHALAMNWDKAFPKRPPLTSVPSAAEQIAGPAAKL